MKIYAVATQINPQEKYSELKITLSKNKSRRLFDERMLNIKIGKSNARRVVLLAMISKKEYQIIDIFDKCTECPDEVEPGEYKYENGVMSRIAPRGN